MAKAVTSFKEAAETLQRCFDTPNLDKEKVNDIIATASRMGSMAWMSHTTPKELKPIVEIFQGRMRTTFLRALKNVVDAPNNSDSIIANRLSPYVNEQLRLCLTA